MSDNKSRTIKYFRTHTEKGTILREEGTPSSEVDAAADNIARCERGTVVLARILRCKAVAVVSMIAPRLRLPTGGP